MKNYFTVGIGIEDVKTENKFIKSQRFFHGFLPDVCSHHPLCCLAYTFILSIRETDVVMF